MKLGNPWGQGLKWISIPTQADIKQGINRSENHRHKIPISILTHTSIREGCVSVVLIWGWGIWDVGLARYLTVQYCYIVLWYPWTMASSQLNIMWAQNLWIIWWDYYIRLFADGIRTFAGSVSNILTRCYIVLGNAPWSTKGFEDLFSVVIGCSGSKKGEFSLEIKEGWTGILQIHIVWLIT